MHLLASGDEYKFRAFQVRAKFVLWARLSPKVGMAPVFPKAIQNEIFLNFGPFAITEQDLDVCYPW